MVSNFQSTFQNKDATQRKQSHRFPDPVCEHPVGGACGRHRHQLPFHPLFDPSLCSFVRRTSLPCGTPPPSPSLMVSAGQITASLGENQRTRPPAQDKRAFQGLGRVCQGGAGFEQRCRPEDDEAPTDTCCSSGCLRSADTTCRCWT